MSDTNDWVMLRKSEVESIIKTNHGVSEFAYQEIQSILEEATPCEAVGEVGYCEIDGKELLVGYLRSDIKIAPDTKLYTTPQVPEGYALVPIEPTEAMKHVAVKEAGDIILQEVYPNGNYKKAVSLDSEMFGIAYKAMLTEAMKGQ